MTDLILTKKRIHAGVWEGILTGTDGVEPELTVSHLGQTVEGVVVAPDPDNEGQYLVAVAIPVEVLTDGVQSFVIQDKVTGDRLSSFAIVTGEPLEDDVRAEVDMLRAELDMLKKAFRRHCLETM
ncbi:hypothetical protein ACMU_00415 [Actibacterium mucosum KCTC 23349]|uniref:Uncharacterized protein n=1 Tax=Actibacterium mucosum KCTC 23349 TaxID=1454373 RepID=A0A037ZLL8_9RHOB|nr:hypothetical protein [Actibacterium mucosum]KAJ56989.1 hypothetical protein ACMU_00415 [Actibacterium mucosum KCTC 23349]